MAHSLSEDSPAAKILKRDFNRFLEWFPGRYDNIEQVYFEENLGIERDQRHGRTHHIFTRVNLPEFPGETFYIEQYRNNDPGDVYRQRIYSFEPDFDENAIRLVIYIPKDADAILGAHANPGKLKDLTPDDFIIYPGCQVYWRYQLDHYHGTMKKGACRVNDPRSGNKPLVVTNDLQLSKSGIWVRDEGVDAGKNYVEVNKAGVHHKNMRARMFKCWVSARKRNGEYSLYPDVALHDQGGEAWLENPEHERVGIRMRNVVWPMGNNRNSLVLYAHRGDDEEQPVSYAWTSPDADRIALNLRWIQASCTLGDAIIIPGLNRKTGGGE